MPDDEVVLSAEAASVANRIEAIDAELTEIEQRTASVVEWGMKGGFSFGAPQRDEAVLDAKRDRLLQQRDGLVQRLKELTGVR